MKVIIDITEQEFNFLKKQVRLGWAQPIEQIIVEEGIILEECNIEDCISRKQAENACLNGCNKDYKEILGDIRKLPSAYPKNTYRSKEDESNN